MIPTNQGSNAQVMPNIIIIIQARMTSQRLPGKVLLPLDGTPVLQVLIERLIGWRKNIVIATTNDGSEAPIVALCEQLDVAYFRGDPEDVLSRYYYAAKAAGAQSGDGIIRLTSDCPLIDNDLCSQVINRYLEGGADMVSLGPHSGFPRGMDCCLFRFDLLEKHHLTATDPFDREHVTHSMPNLCTQPCIHIHADEDLSHYRLTLDEPDDYKAIDEVYRLFNYRRDFDYPDLVGLLHRHPHIYELNKHVMQKNT